MACVSRGQLPSSQHHDSQRYIQEDIYRCMGYTRTRNQPSFFVGKGKALHLFAGTIVLCRCMVIHIPARSTYQNHTVMLAAVGISTRTSIGNITLLLFKLFYANLYHRYTQPFTSTTQGIISSHCDSPNCRPLPSSRVHDPAPAMTSDCSGGLDGCRDKLPVIHAVDAVNCQL